MFFGLRKSPTQPSPQPEPRNDLPKTQTSTEPSGWTYRYVDLCGTIIRLKIRDSELSRETLFKEIFGGKSYPIMPGLTDVKTIVDVGANVGCASLFFHAAYPEAEVFAYEPDPVVYGVMRENIEPFQDRIFPRNYGVGPITELGKFHRNSEDGVCSSLTNHQGEHEETIDVDIVGVTEFFLQFDKPIDILKVDTEGVDAMVIEGMFDVNEKFCMWSLPQLIYVEYHNFHDRLRIEEMMKDRYILVSAHTSTVHQGENTWVRADIFMEAFTQRIPLPRTEPPSQ